MFVKQKCFLNKIIKQAYQHDGLKEDICIYVQTVIQNVLKNKKNN